ncbi:MAG: hypothetical protein UR52_C0001G0111 [Candidatus Gottesmanbacteria bacterium GW2011_GWA1_34_13]|uniref:DZANK-type domain-containing protein n=1 Tax=Candidatus Gottesmanbacteria bacterium GW2011_GWA1_34_13 TaxID=1618434 RepID=A0A0G0B8K4_9BACT|nr:MAG: hypothetical protein UR52_C0001G0111 [Candidatus Gottesmanbacteria bacterium GW2011_GWA1_34_13]
MDQNIIKCSHCQKSNLITDNYCINCGMLLRPSLINESQKCPFCANIIKPEDIFCPYCGKKIRQKILSSSIWRQIYIYSLSFLLPPLGLWPAFKYLRASDKKLKAIGFVAVLLTFISIMIAAVFAINIMNQVNDEVSKQMQNLLQF